MKNTSLPAVPLVRPARGPAKEKIYNLSRAVSVGLVGLGVGSLYLQPTTGAEWILDVIMRSWLMFLCTVMAHECTHGQMGRTRKANMWWGWFSLILPTVPYVNFRKTHMKHHVHTNDPTDDPDFFVVPKYTALEIPFRAVAHPHHWIWYLGKRGMISRRDAVEWAMNYVFLFALYGSIGYFAGWQRLAIGMGAPLVIVSLVLWYWFALKTHEGFSVGDSEFQSHNYYGRLTFWLTLGLSMHRVHHEHPKLTWIEALPFVEEDPLGFWNSYLGIRRDIRVEPVGAS